MSAALVWVLISIASSAGGLAHAENTRQTRCLPFDDKKATLDTGFWTFSMPGKITDRNCTHTYDVVQNVSSDSEGCSLHRFEASEARSCLSGKHVVFIGDSVSRHQFESLIIWLQTGKHAVPQRRNPTPFLHEFAVGTGNSNGCGQYSVRCDYDRVETDLTLKVDNRYFRLADFDINVTAFGLYAFAYGHSPVGWFPPDVPFHQPNFEWQRGGMPHIAAAIKKWFGQVDVIIANVGIWALEDLVPTMWESQAHYMTGPMEKVLDELNMLTPLSREVCDVLLGLPSLVVVSRL
jgi:GDSL/SGNH-like Acyl-Esterase family found in Pmr5 and Cas1p